MNSFELCVVGIAGFLVINCQAQDGGPSLIFTDAKYQRILKIDIESLNIYEIASEGIRFPWGVALDSINRMVYWTNVDYNLVQRTVEGSAQIEIIQKVSYPQGIAIDLQQGKVYVTESGTPAIIRMNFDGSEAEFLISDGLVDPDDICLGPDGKFVYWIDSGLKAVRRADMNALKPGNHTNTTYFNNPSAIEVDRFNRKVYWVDAGSGKLIRSDLDGTHVELVASGLTDPDGLALDSKNNIIYWSDRTDLKIYALNLSTLAQRELVQLDDQAGFHIDLAFSPN